jgi:hypothetical protein
VQLGCRGADVEAHARLSRLTEGLGIGPLYQRIGKQLLPQEFSVLLWTEVQAAEPFQIELDRGGTVVRGEPDVVLPPLGVVAKVNCIMVSVPAGQADF